MITHNFEQGTREWLSYRAWPTKNASDAPVIMGKSPYKTRSKFLDEIASGLAQEVDQATQRIFDDGHRFEALARPVAAQIIGYTLYPVTGSNGEYSASFDGLTMDESIAFEHKTLNDDIRNTQSVDDLRIDYRIQMEQQLLVSGAEKCLFLATKWDDNDNLLEERHFWYEPDLILREQIIAGWIQFEKDLETHVPAVIAEMPKAEAIMQLPAINIQVSGGLQSSNLNEVTKAFDGFLENANTELVTDEDFANGEATAKFSRDTAKKLKLTRQQIIDQVADISEATRIIDLYASKFDALGLQLEKLVKSEKEARKIAIANEAVKAFADHKAALEKEISPIRLITGGLMLQEAMKSKRTIASLQDAANTDLARAKIEADAVAKDIRAKLHSFKEHCTGYEFLFSDLQSIIYKEDSDFYLICSTRIDQHKKTEVEKLEQQREQIRKEEEAKAQEKANTKQVVIEQQTHENVFKQNVDNSQSMKDINLDDALKQSFGKTRKTKPTRDALINSIASEFKVDFKVAEQWLIEEFSQETEAA